MSRRTATLVCLPLLCAAWDSAAGQGGSSSERSALAIRYEEGKSTAIRMDGTPLAPRLKGKAKVATDGGNAAIEIEFDDLPPAIKVAPGYATYVLWAITPDGRTENLGEFPWRGDPKMKASLPVQRFALIVTAEPYSAVARPSPRIVSEDKLKDGEDVATTGGVSYLGDDGKIYGGSGPETNSKTPEPVAAARLSVQIARRAGADTFAKGEISQAVSTLSRMESAYQDKPKDEGRWGSFARETQSLAHAARTTAGQRRADAVIANERQAQAKAAAAAQQQSLAAQQQAAFEQTSAAMKRAEQAVQERDAPAQQLESSLNSILETKRSARGLVVNIGDVLFDLGQASLRPEARERLSRLSGVLLAYPGPYTLEFEGHTDSTGADELNNRLSDARASAVRDYLVGAGVRGDRVIGTRGFGKSNPVASNDTAD
jgi:outer membrane protein OmpA-like peptidoglycan-associated protein